MAIAGTEMRIWIIDDDGQEHEVTGEVGFDFELRIEPVPGAEVEYKRWLQDIKPIEIVAHCKLVYQWFGELMAGAFSFSKN